MIIIVYLSVLLLVILNIVLYKHNKLKHSCLECTKKCKGRKET